MNILLYRYGSICEPDLLETFQKIGLTVIEEKTEITHKSISNSERVQLVEKSIKAHQPLLVFSINFYPAIAEICQIYQTPYFCWTVDSPVPELFSESICRNTNRIFLFDRAQYRQFAPYNPSCVFHLPLASATERFDKVIDTITKQDREKFSNDIAFVGSLYSEKSPLAKLSTLSEYGRGYLDALEESSLKVYGYNFIEEALDERIVKEIKTLATDFYDPGKAIAASEKYVAAHSYIGMEIAVKERILTLETLANYFAVDLYTMSDTGVLGSKCLITAKNNASTPHDQDTGCTAMMQSTLNTMAETNRQSIPESVPSSRKIGLRLHGGVASLTEMPKIFHLSKLNLNMTIKPIMEGLPLRIFDILGCGGFCMTNYQAELPELFEIGQEIEAYSSLEELVEKCDYYLTHEDERRRIAENGYKKVCEKYTYYHRIKEMITNGLSQGLSQNQ